MRINKINKALKSPGTCGNCGKVIQKGDPYKWVKGRYTLKKVRCDKCTFKASDLTTSKMGAVYDAQDNAREEIAALASDAQDDARNGTADNWADDYTSDLSSALQTLADEVRDVSEQYRESSEGIRGAFTDSPKADELEEKADNLEMWADELEGVVFDDLESGATPEQKQDWVYNQSEEATAAVDNCPE